MTAKELKIKEAYGKYWDKVKDHINSNGWVCMPTRSGDEIPELEELGITGGSKILFEENWDDDLYGYRPKSLSGIENNNGWIKIESEKDLPKENNIYFVSIDGIQITTYHFNNRSDFDKVIWLEEFTHYQQILKPKPPLY